MSDKLIAKNRSIEFGNKTLLMGILNVTPDSFSDGGNFTDQNKAVTKGLTLLSEGADILDIGGESTRPGSDPVTLDEELSRVIPVIEAINRKKPDAIISIDTQKPDVAKAAILAGAHIINDVSGLQYSVKTAEIAASTGAGLIIMHMRGVPKTMQEQLHYSDILDEIKSFLNESIKTALKMGVSKEQIALDPGIGFGKNIQHNLKIISNIDYFKKIGYPLVSGPSRKAFIGELTGVKIPEERLMGTAGAVAYLAQQCCEIIRVHDVLSMKHMLAVYDTMKNFNDI